MVWKRRRTGGGASGRQAAATSRSERPSEREGQIARAYRHGTEDRPRTGRTRTGSSDGTPGVDPAEDV